MIKIQDNALLRLRELKEKHNKKYVRLDVKGGGCIVVLIMSGLLMMKIE